MDEEEKRWAMRLITNSVVTNRWEHTRIPPDSAEMSSTVILKVKVVDGSGKIRSGSASDERKDAENEEVTSRVWAGVVPVWETFGQPIPSPDNKVTEVPGYISSFIHGRNERNRADAEAAATVKFPGEEQH
ncbi:hypothetical protein PHISCL_10450 [Aspergillus sclerotialis]|uniref:Uncharacterized protein n=1 Tax=Aspergillus sclerotialis TaxID=2070753 RepID=A0A3A2Z4W9_9EURO|nr:hypothetical protein PHISCL_10450 [Aspergillus sclerotialis]